MAEWQAWLDDNNMSLDHIIISVLTCLKMCSDFFSFLCHATGTLPNLVLTPLTNDNCAEIRAGTSFPRGMQNAAHCTGAQSKKTETPRNPEANRNPYIAIAREFHALCKEPGEDNLL